MTFDDFGDFGDYIIYDGAIGTMLQRNGLKPGQRPDIMNITSPDIVERIHRMYVEAGSDIICTNTFGANADTLRSTGYSPEDIITEAVGVAKRAAGSAAKVALDIGPIGALLEPMGELEYDRAYELFKEQAVAGEKAGADFAAIETMSDLSELKAAILAVAENTKLPVLASMTFNKNGRTYFGVTPGEFAEMAGKLGAAAVGVNCSVGPAEIAGIMARISESTRLPLIIKPNAGLPDSVTGMYNIDPHEFTVQMVRSIKAVEAANNADPGLKEQDGRRRFIIGGCCGTTPDYIRELRKIIKKDN